MGYCMLFLSLGLMLFFLGGLVVCSGLGEGVLNGTIYLIVTNIPVIIVGGAFLYLVPRMPEWVYTPLVVVLCALYALGGVVYVIAVLKGWSDCFASEDYWEAQRNFLSGLLAMGVGGYFAIQPALPVRYLREMRAKHLLNEKVEALEKQYRANVRAKKAAAEAAPPAARKKPRKKPQKQAVLDDRLVEAR